MHLLKRFKYELIILGVVLLLVITNYQAGTYLSGWDNLQTDLNPFLGVKRAFFSLWQEYQSLGLLAGMGHAADLVRALLIYLLSFVLPSSMLRYTFHFLMLLLGSLGMLRLLEQAGFDKDKKKYALLGSLFYIFNFEVTQMMFFPFEPFSVFVAMLPWEIWIFLKVLTERRSLKDFGLLFLINVLATPQGVAQQLFVVYGLLLGLLTIGQLIQTRSKKILSHAILAGLLILAANSFWLMPQVYFLATSGSVVKEAKINQLATQDVLYANKDKGNLSDFLRFEGFFYDRVDQNQHPLFTDWKNYRTTIPVTIAIYALSLLSLVGVFIKSKYRLGFVLCLGLAALTLLSNTPPFTIINDVIRSNSLINQIFRSPFTKFSIPLALICAYLFTVTIASLDQKFSTLKFTQSLSKRRSKLTPALFLGLLLVLGSTLPSFHGQNISSVMKVSFPKPYTQLMDYFKGVDKNKRIALLPEYTFWGWYHYKWGYDGSGFLWYGIEQPIISRTFDVWSLTSESYFWELKTALEADDPQALQRVLTKYNVDYVLFDTSLLPIVSSTKGIQYQSITNLLNESSYLHKEQQWGSLSLYKVTNTDKTKSFVSLGQDLPNIGPSIQTTNNDTAYVSHGTYLTDPSKDYDYYYPFLDLMTQTQIADKDWSIKESFSDWQFSSKIPESITNYRVLLATSSAINLYRDKAIQYSIPVTSQTSQDTFSLSFPKVTLDSFVPGSATVLSCSDQYQGLIRTEVEGNSLKLIARNGATGCFGFEDSTLDQRYGYLVTIDHENLLGQPFFFYILDQTKDQAYVEDRLTTPQAHYILGSKYIGGLGYNFTFQGTSLPTTPAINTLKRISVDLLPYEQIKDVTLEKSGVAAFSPHFSDNFSVNKEQYYRYLVTLEPSQNAQTIILHQSYHPGWHAYLLPQGASILQKALPFLSQPLSHTKVNNWENGWDSKASSTPQTIVLLFLPQYLEYAGLFAILATLLVFPTYKLLSRNRHKT